MSLNARSIDQLRSVVPLVRREPDKVVVAPVSLANVPAAHTTTRLEVLETIFTTLLLEGVGMPVIKKFWPATALAKGAPEAAVSVVPSVVVTDRVVLPYEVKDTVTPSSFVSADAAKVSTVGLAVTTVNSALLATVAHPENLTF